MIDVLIWQSTGHRDSMATALFLAALLRAQGSNVDVVFSRGALVSLAERKLYDSPEIASYSDTINDVVEKMGFSTDTMDYLEQCKTAGVGLYASTNWVSFLAVKDKLPAEIEIIEPLQLAKLIMEAKKVIGAP